MKAKKKDEVRRRISVRGTLFLGFVILILLASVLISMNAGSGEVSESKGWFSLGLKELAKKGWSSITGADIVAQGISIQGRANATSCGTVNGALTLTADVNSTGTCFTINASDITLDCDNYLITGNKTGYGVYINSYQGVTIKNCNVNNFSRGIWLDNSSNNNLTNNNVYSNGDDGIFLYFNSNNNTLTNNNVYNTIINGIRLQDSSHNNTLSSNKIYDNSKGILLSNSNNNFVYNNYFDNTNNVQDNGNNSWNITYNCSSGSNIVGGSCFGGNAWSDYNGIDNNGDDIGDTLIPYNNSNNIQAGGDYLPLLFPNCRNVSNNLILTKNLTTNETCFTVTADNIEIDCQGYIIDGDDSGTDYGIYVSNYNNLTVRNCIIKDFHSGVYLDDSNNSLVENSNISSDTYAGVSVNGNSQWGIIKNCSISEHPSGNGGAGNIVLQNGYIWYWNITNNRFHDSAGGQGVVASYSNGNRSFNYIANNNFTGVSGHGIYFIDHAYYNTIENNTFKGFSSSGGGGIYLNLNNDYNNFTNNTFNNNNRGIYIRSYNNLGNKYNIFKENNFLNCAVGLEIGYYYLTSYDNEFYDNEFNGSTSYGIQFGKTGGYEPLTMRQTFSGNLFDGQPFYTCYNNVWNDNNTANLTNIKSTLNHVTNLGVILADRCDNVNLDNVTVVNHTSSDNGWGGVLLYGSDNITIKNSNFTSNGLGVRVDHSDSVNFSNSVFYDNTNSGIHSLYSHYGLVDNSTFSQNTGSGFNGGIYFDYNNTYWNLSNNLFDSNYRSIFLYGGNSNTANKNNSFINNTFKDNTDSGIYLNSYANDNVFRENDFINNKDGFYIVYNYNTGNTIEDNEFNGSTDYDIYFNGLDRLNQQWGENFADGYPFYICYNNNSWSLSNYLIPVDRVTRYGSLIIEGCTNAVLNNVSVVNHANSLYGYGGVLIYSSSNVKVNNSNFTDNKNGLRIENSNNAVFQNSVFKSNDQDGLYIQNSDYGTVLNCTFSDQTTSPRSGVHFKDYNDYWNISQSNFVYNYISAYVYSGTTGRYNNNNTINNNIFIGEGRNYGVYVGIAKDNVIRNNNFSGFTTTGGRNAAITLYDDVEHTTIANNSIKNNYRGVYIESAANTTVADNELINSSDYAIKVVGPNADDNWFYKNNFENNTNSPPVSCNDADNYFNTSPPAGGGNYWDDYQTVTGVACVDGNSDGFCDTPYNISSSVNDSLPYVYPVGGGGLSCGDTITTDTNLTADLICSGTALTIGADNIVLDCDGHKINYSTAGVLGYGINNSGGFDNITIKNCNIYEGNVIGSAKYAINFQNADNGTIENNNITTIGNYSIGVYLNYASNVSVNKTRIDTSGNYGYGVYLNDTNNTLVKRANITTFGNSGWGVYMSGTATLNNFSNCWVFSSSASPAVYLKGDDVDNNVIEYSYIEVNSSNSLGVYVNNGDGNKFLYNVINQSNTDGVNAFELYNNANNNILVGNNMSNAKSTIFNEPYAVLYIHNSAGTNVTGNRLDNMNQLSFYVDGSNASQYNHTFSNNLGDGVNAEYIGPDDTRNSLENVNLKELFIAKDNFVVNKVTINDSEGVRIVYANGVIINETKINASLGDVARSVKGLYLDQANNASVKGVNITTSGKNGQGIYLDNAKDNNFYGVKVTTLDDGRSIYLEDSTSRNNFSNCWIISSSSASVYLNGNYVDNNIIEYSYIEAKGNSLGVDVSGGDGNKFLYNVINQSNITGYNAFSLHSFSDNNTLVGNNISNSRSGFSETNGAVLQIYNSLGTNVSGNRLENPKQNKVYVDSSSTGTFADNYFGVSGGNIQANSLRMAAGTALLNFSNNIFVGPKMNLDGFQFNMSNSTFRSADGTADITYPNLVFNGSSNFQLNASNVYVLDNISAVDPANANLNESFNTTAKVTFYNVSCSGFGIYYDSSFVTNYTVLTGGSTVATQADIGGNCTNDVCTDIACSGSTLSMTVPAWSSFGVKEQGNALPIVENVTLNSTYGTNYSNENLTVYWDTYDANGDNVTNITNWYLDGSSIAVLNMPFEADGNQNSTDYSGYGNDGTVMNDTTWNSAGGYDGWGAYKFDGIDDKVFVDNSSSLDNLSALTAEAWVKVDSYDQINGSYPTDFMVIVKKGFGVSGKGGFLLVIGPSGVPGMIILNGTNWAWESANTSNPVSLNTWYHLVGTFNGSTIKFYRNGVAEASKEYPTGTLYTGDEALYIGADSSARWFNGTIDEVRVYNRVLSAEQIKALYENRTDLLVSEETSAGDVWKACVTPNDRMGDGVENCSNNLTVLGSVGCGTINSNTTLTADVSSTGTCFTINASDITLDCAGYKINYSTAGTGGYGINDTGFSNVTIKNCNIYEGNVIGSAKYAINFQNADNGTIENNNITTIGNSAGVHFHSSFSLIIDNIINSAGKGIELSDSNSNNITNNTIDATPGSGQGISFSSSNNNKLSNNKIKANGFGIYLESSSGNNTLLNSNISTNSIEISDETGNSYVNYLIYNNSYGEIKWTNTSDGGFLKDMEVTGSIALGTNLFIGDNVAALNTSAFTGKINSSANITLRGLSFGAVNEIRRLESYNTSSSEIITSGVNCVGTSCSILSYDNSTGTLVFNTSYFSSFAGNQLLCVDNDNDGFGAVGTDITPCTYSYAYDCNDNNASILPPADNLNISNNTILCNGTFYINDNAADGLVKLNADNITLRCNSTILIGNNSGYGIFNGGYDGVTIEGCTIKNYTIGIQLEGDGTSNYVKDNIVLNNIIANTSSGIYMHFTSNNTIKNNYFHRPAYFGIHLYYYSEHNTIENNTIKGEDYTNQGIRLHSWVKENRYNIIKNNNINDTLYGIYATGISNNNTFDNNTIISSGIWGIFIDQSDENNITNNKLFGENDATYGIYVKGISMDNSLNNILKNNWITEATDYGIKLEYANLTIVRDNIVNDSIYGNYIINSSGSTIKNNVFYKNNYSVYIDSGTGNTFYYNNFTDSINYHAYANSTGNYFNISIGGKPQGNYWGGVENLEIFDSDNDDYGDSGSQYPYSKVNGGKVSDYVVDWGPITSKTAAVPAVTGGISHRRAACSDKKDNDGDSLIDREDPGCHRYNNLSDAYLPYKDSEDGDVECTEDRCEGSIVNICLNGYYYRERGEFKWESIEGVYGEGWACVDGRVEKIEVVPLEPVPPAPVPPPPPVEEVKEVEVEMPVELSWWQRLEQWFKEKAGEVGVWFKGIGKTFEGMGEVLSGLTWLWIILVIVLLFVGAGVYAHKKKIGIIDLFAALGKGVKDVFKAVGIGIGIILTKLVGLLDAILSWPVKVVMMVRGFFRRKRKEKEKEELVERKKERKIEAAERKEKALELGEFIIGSMKQGVAKEEIKEMLVEKGWPEEIVEEYVEKIRKKIEPKVRVSKRKKELEKSLGKVEKELERTEQNHGYLARKVYGKSKVKKKKLPKKVVEKPVVEKKPERKESGLQKKLKKDLDYVEEELRKLS